MQGLFRAVSAYIQIMERGVGKAAFGEMAIKGESRGDFSGVHDFKTEAVGEAPISASFNVQSLNGPIVPFLIHPDDVRDRQDLSVEIPHGIKADATLQKRQRLQEYIRAREK